MREHKKLHTIFALLVITSISSVLPVTAEENDSTTIDQERGLNWAEPPDDLPERVSSDPKDEGLPGVKYINTSKYRSDRLPYKQISAIKSPYETKLKGNYDLESENKQSEFVYDFLPNKTIKATNIQKAEDPLTVSTKDTVPSVRVTTLTYTWYWVQDTQFDNFITIHNYGNTTAYGKVLFGSIEDGYAHYHPFYNLDPGEEVMLAVPFYVNPLTVPSVGIKPAAVEVWVGPNDVSTHSFRLPVDCIEKYNNDQNHLFDPNGGENLDTSDVYHFPLNEGYRIISEAAYAGDDTTTPRETASEIMIYVYNSMHYDHEMVLDRTYTAADLWIVNHTNASDNKYIGVCDEYTVLFNAFNRALGIPSKQYYMEANNSTNVIIEHEFSEVWNGTEWIHVDSSWSHFDNPSVYVDNDYTHVHLWNLKNADDSRYSGDPFGDLLLKALKDFEVVDQGEVPKYN